MPRIPYSLASGEIPGRIPLSDRPQPAVWALPGRAIQNLGGEIEQISGQLQEVDRRLQAGKDVVAKAQLLSELHGIAAERQLNPDTSVSSSEYRARVAQELQERLDIGLQGISEGNRDAVRAEAIGRIGTWAIEAQGASAKRAGEETVQGFYEQSQRLSNLGTPEALAEIQATARMLVGTGHLTASEGQAAERYFRRQILDNAFARKKNADPDLAAEDVANKAGIFASLNDDERDHYLGIARAESQRVKDKLYQERKRREQEHEEVVAIQMREKTSTITSDLMRGMYAEQELPVLLQGLPMTEQMHLNSFANTLKVRVREQTNVDRAEADRIAKRGEHDISVNMPLLTRIADVHQVVRTGELALAGGKIRPEELESIKYKAQRQILFIQEQQRHVLTQQEASDRQFDRDNQVAYAAAKAQAGEWLGISPLLRQDPLMEKAYQDAEHLIFGAGQDALYARQPAMAAMRQKVPEALSYFYGQMGNARQELWGILAPYTSVEEFRLAYQVGKITDKVKALRQFEAARALELIEQLNPTPTQPSPEAAPSKPPQRKPFTPPPRGASPWMPGEIGGF